jgi:hypothetical protein
MHCINHLGIFNLLNRFKVGCFILLGSWQFTHNKGPPSTSFPSTPIVITGIHYAPLNVTTTELNPGASNQYEPYPE